VDRFFPRLFISIILVTLFWAVIYICPDWVYCIVVSIMIAIGQYEFFRMVSKRGYFVYKYFGTIAGALIPFVIFAGLHMPELKNLETLLIVIAGLFALILQFIRKDDSNDHIVSTAITVFALFYIGWFFSFMVKIKFLPEGSNLVAYLIIVTKAADMGAYSIGRIFGRTELIPRISPKKTKEGTVGGILVGAVLSVVFGRFLTDFSIVHLLILGIVFPVLGQIGDLAESLIKRNCEVKDSGTYLMGIGGMLDLIDSLLFTAPVFFFYLKTF